MLKEKTYCQRAVSDTAGRESLIKYTVKEKGIDPPPKLSWFTPRIRHANWFLNSIFVGHMLNAQERQQLEYYSPKVSYMKAVDDLSYLDKL